MTAQTERLRAMTTPDNRAELARLVALRDAASPAPWAQSSSIDWPLDTGISLGPLIDLRKAGGESQVDADAAFIASIHDLVALAERQAAEIDESEKRYLSAVNGRQEFRQALIEARTEIEELRAAALDVVTRWDSPLWKHTEHTGVFIDRLRKAIGEAP